MPFSLGSTIMGLLPNKALVRVSSPSKQFVNSIPFKFLQGLTTQNMNLLHQVDKNAEYSTLYSYFLNNKGQFLFDSFINYFESMSCNNTSYYIEIDSLILPTVIEHFSEYNLYSSTELSIEVIPPSEISVGYFIHPTIADQFQFYQEFIVKNSPILCIYPDPRPCFNRLIPHSNHTELQPGAHGVVDRIQISRFYYRTSINDWIDNYAETPVLYDADFYNGVLSSLGLLESSLLHSTSSKEHFTSLNTKDQETKLSKYFPFELNGDVVNAMNFKNKGCYIGQEFTMRTKTQLITRKRILPSVMNKFIINEYSTPSSVLPHLFNNSTKHLFTLDTQVYSSNQSLRRTRKGKIVYIHPECKYILVHVYIDQIVDLDATSFILVPDVSIAVKFPTNFNYEQFEVGVYVPHWWPGSTIRTIFKHLPMND